MEFPAHQLTMTVLMTPDTANFAGNVHGGTLLKLLDQAAYWTTAGSSQRYIAPDRNGGYMKTGRVFQLSLTMTR